MSSATQNLVYYQPIEQVYNAAIAAAQSLKYKVSSVDPLYHVVNLSVPISLFTWGEQLTINFYTIQDGRTSVIFTCKSNLGTEIAASSKNKKNIDKLVQAMNNFLG